MTTNNITDKLVLLRAYQKEMLVEYVELLNRVFQVIYEVEENVEWVSIERCTPTSNFGIVKGIVTLPEGTPVKNMQGEYASFKDNKVFDAGFIFPLESLDDCTPYQIAEYVHQIKMLQVIATPAEFIAFLNDPNNKADDVDNFLPSDISREHREAIECEEDEQILQELRDNEIQKRNAILPDSIKGFNMNTLSEKQTLSLMINLLGESNGNKQ